MWNTKTTDFKVTNSPLGADVLAALRKSCDKFGLKLALYFSEGDWTWLEGPLPQDGLLPGSPNWGNAVWASSKNPDAKKAQLDLPVYLTLRPDDDEEDHPDVAEPASATM